MSSSSWIYMPDTSNYSENDTLVILAVAFVLCIFFAAIIVCSQSTCYRRRSGVVATRTAYEFRNDSGLSPAGIAALPIFAYRRNLSDKSDGDGGWAQCAVCLNLVQEEETVRQLPKCKHLFHVECIDMWLYSHSTCPLCRTTVEPIEACEGFAPV